MQEITRTESLVDRKSLKSTVESVVHIIQEP